MGAAYRPPVLNCCFFFAIISKKYIMGMIYLLCNAPIQKLKEILISSLWHLIEIYITFRNSTYTSFHFYCAAYRPRVFNCRFLAITSQMVKIYLTDTNYLYYCLMDMKIDR